MMRFNLTEFVPKPRPAPEVALSGQKALTLPPEAIQHAFEKFQASLSPEFIAELNGRLERGLEMARRGAVAFQDDPALSESQHLFMVSSSITTKPPYLVDLQARSCECPDHWKGHFCKHLIAANIIQMAWLGTNPSSPDAVPAVREETQPAAQPIHLPSSPVPQPDSVVWGVIRLDGQCLGVEVLSISGEQATVRALPKVIDGKKLQPQFPFQGKRCTATIPKKELSHVKIFQ